MVRPSESRGVQLALLPNHQVTSDHFKLELTPLRELINGEVLTQTHFISLDPVTRLRMRAAHDAGDTSQVGIPIASRTIDQVIESQHPSFLPGDLALGWAGWQEYAIQQASDLTRIDHTDDQLWAWLGPLGRPGITAWLGIERVLQVSSEDIVIVTSAAGAVGSVAAQLAKARGARVIGIAGGTEKCNWLVEQAGLDAAINYKEPSFEDALASATPSGATALFECVGGPIMDTVLTRLRPHSRVALCGMLDRYDGREAYPFKNLHLLLVNALSLTGFRIDDHQKLHRNAVAELTALHKTGKLTAQATISWGLDSLPNAFIDMLAGRGSGKHVIAIRAR